MNRFENITKPLMWFMALLLTAFIAGCGGGGNGSPADTTAPTVSLIAPANAATGIALNANITATFSEAMDASTITTTTFTLKQGTASISGAVTYVGKTAVFNPTSNLTASLVYTATVTTGVKDLAGNALAANKTWSFTTGTTVAAGPKPVILGTAGDYAILTKTGISTTTTAGTAVTGDIAVSPAAATYIVGFSLALDGTGCFSTTTPTTLVTGKVYAADYNTGGCTTPANLTTAVLNMEAAYTDAAGRTATSAATTNVGGGTLANLTLAPGVYEWGSNVNITTDLHLNGAATDVWIFKVAGTLDLASAKSVILSGALAKNVFWQVADVVTIGTGAHFEGC